MEKIVKKYGFESLKEFNKLISSVDLSDPNIFIKFKMWQKTDGSKAGLLKVIGDKNE